MASFLYQRGVAHLLGAGDVTASAAIKAMLVTSGYTPDKDHDFVADVTPGSNELSGTGYTRKTLTNVTCVPNDTTDRAVIDADDVTWTAINAGTVAACILYVEVTDDADRVLLAYIDSGGFPIVTSGQDLTLSWNANGIAYIG